MKTGKCRGCGAELIWAMNAKTGKNLPLVETPQDYDKTAHRYTLDAEDDTIVHPDPSGAWLSHFANCPSVSQFGGKK